MQTAVFVYQDTSNLNNYLQAGWKVITIAASHNPVAFLVILEKNS